MFIRDLDSGLGRLDRERLSAVLLGTKGTISNEEAARITGLDRAASSQLLARWCRKGWLSRVTRGLYVPLPLEAERTTRPLEDPWLIADRLYSPCYIGGFSAGEHWDLTDQIFRTIIVITQRHPRDRNPRFGISRYWVVTMSPQKMFGLKATWCGGTKVSVSDPGRTILDALVFPQLGGGIRHTRDMLKEYLDSDAKALERLLDYAERLGNGAVFKRLGFILETEIPREREAIERCRRNLTSGTARIDRSMPAHSLVTRWRLWVPRNWKEGMTLSSERDYHAQLGNSA